MRNFIGNLLIILAAFISFARNLLFFVLTMAIIMGILITTMIGLFELIGMISPNPEYQFVVFGKWYWDLIVVVLGGSTMWLGFSKMVESDKAEKKMKTKNREYLFK
jgi:hypothetical protein